jgi:hypothetical protein
MIENELKLEEEIKNQQEIDVEQSDTQFIKEQLDS